MVMDQRTCPNCGMTRDMWPDDGDGGYLKDGVAYCCRGCGEGTGCTCSRELSEEMEKAVDGERHEQRPRMASGAASTPQQKAGDAPERAPTHEEIRDDRASGDFVRSLQKDTKRVTPADYGTELTDGPAPRTSSND
jgi:hypothetical protein